MEQNKTGNEQEERKLKLDDDVSFMDEQTAASSMECTGLIPSAPQTEDEVESYANIYPVPAPKQANNVKIRKKPIHHHKSDGKNT